MVEPFHHSRYYDGWVRTRVQVGGEWQSTPGASLDAAVVVQRDETTTLDRANAPSVALSLFH
jgi:hypothetical protein